MSATPDKRGGVSRVRRGGGRASTLSPLKGRFATNNNNAEDSKSSSMIRLYQGIVSLRKFRSKVKNEHLPHHNNKDNVHIQVPLRMMLSTLSIFLIFPLILFGWRQFHPTIRTDLSGVEGAQNFSKALNHDRFPTWMDEIKLPPLKSFESDISDESAANNGTTIDVDLGDSSSETKSGAPNDSPQQANDPVNHVLESMGDKEVGSHSKVLPEERVDEEEETEEVKETQEEEEVKETSG